MHTALPSAYWRGEDERLQEPHHVAHLVLPYQKGSLARSSEHHGCRQAARATLPHPTCLMLPPLTGCPGRRLAGAVGAIERLHGRHDGGGPGPRVAALLGLALPPRGRRIGDRRVQLQQPMQIRLEHELCHGERCGTSASAGPTSAGRAAALFRQVPPQLHLGALSTTGDPSRPGPLPRALSTTAVHPPSHSPGAPPPQDTC